MSAPNREQALAALRGVVDPELGIDIVSLGLVYALTAGPERIELTMTMTSPACPMSTMLVAEVEDALAALAPDGTAVDVRLVWEPAWTPERMSAEARERFGWSD